MTVRDHNIIWLRPAKELEAVVNAVRMPTSTLNDALSTRNKYRQECVNYGAQLVIILSDTTQIVLTAYML